MKALRILLTYLIFGLVSANSVQAQEPELINPYVIPTTEDHDSLRFAVVIPPSYENSSRSYPVIYYMHGMNRYYAGPRAQWIASFFNKQFEEQLLPEFIMVFIDGGEGYWMDHVDGEPLLETAIMKFLIPHMDANYRTDPSKRLTMGYSLGGNGSVFFYARHPDMFTAAISLDGGIITYEDWLSRTGGRTDIISNADYFYEYGSPYEWVKRNRESLLEKPDTSIFLSAAFLKEANKGFLSILEEQGIPAKYIEVNCTHEFGCVFSKSQEELLRFMASRLDGAQ
jgi:hypothetical protein